MKSSRLEQLYQRNLVSPESAGKSFPLQYVLNQEVNYFPEKPANLEFDVLEIGPGRGDFLFHLAELNPQKRMIAIERGKLRYMRLMDRMKKRGLENITLVGSDARIPLAKDLKDARFGKIYVLFPDPWPRNRHRHKRLLNKEFLQTLVEKLPVGGEFTLATDVEDYARWVMTHFQDMPNMENIQGLDTTKTPLPDLIPTFFEQKWKDIGRICHYVRYKRTA